MSSVGVLLRYRDEFMFLLKNPQYERNGKVSLTYIEGKHNNKSENIDAAVIEVVRYATRNTLNLIPERVKKSNYVATKYGKLCRCLYVVEIDTREYEVLHRIVDTLLRREYVTDPKNSQYEGLLFVRSDKVLAGGDYMYTDEHIPFCKSNEYLLTKAINENLI